VATPRRLRRDHDSRAKVQRPSNINHGALCSKEQILLSSGAQLSSSRFGVAPHYHRLFIESNPRTSKMAEKTPSLLASDNGIGESVPQQGGVGEDGLQKHLKDRHLSMIALGGALGTGLLVGT